MEFALLGTWFASALQRPELTGQNCTFASIAFILSAYILGHSIQAIAQWIPDKSSLIRQLLTPKLTKKEESRFL